MSVAPVPGYEVEFIPFERRLVDRRVAQAAALPAGVSADRRKAQGRRAEDRSPQPKLKAVR